MLREEVLGIRGKEHLVEESIYTPPMERLQDRKRSAEQAP